MIGVYFAWWKYGDRISRRFYVTSAGAGRRNIEELRTRDEETQRERESADSEHMWPNLVTRVEIHGCRNCIYDRKIYDSVVDLLMKLAQFWYFGHVSKSLVAKSTTAMNPNPGMDYGKKDRKR